MLRGRLIGALLLVGAVAAPTRAFATTATDPLPEAEQPGCIVSQLSGLCELVVNDEVHQPGDEGKPGKTTKASKTGCRFEGQEIPCKTADGFWDPGSRCYLTPQPQQMSLTDNTKYPPGTKFYRCWYLLGVIDGKLDGLARFESEVREPGEQQTIDPRVAAQQVVATMNFVAPQLGLSPFVQSARREGVVNSPVWMWVTDPGESTTGPLSARVTLGGVTIEATGTLDRIEWSMGDGETVSCKGAGTPFDRSAMEGKSLKEVPASPTCGHKYVKTSRCEKGGQFPVGATAYWNVHWTGGGMEGDIPLQFTRSTTLSVVDLRPVLVAPDSAGHPQVTSPARSCS
ncbi:hypothetical protein GCM10009741_02840 [Kribbella lupini]|uniref:ATP/GTP-binding protein n=2 Tax=Kribbella lupini TaxID=291602 RepID=A0ABN2A1H3_9ACTN